MVQCYFCGTDISDTRVYRTTVCPKCGRDLKICRNCQFYSPGSPYDCRENISDLVRDKEKANFCDFFALGENSSSKNNSRQEKARNAFDQLFGGDE